MLNNLNVKSLQTRYINMVEFYHLILKQIRFLQTKTSPQTIHYEFSDHIFEDTSDKTYLITQCGHMERIINCAIIRKQQILTEAREHSPLTHCPKCEKNVKIRYYYEIASCIECENEKGLKVMKYV